MTQADLNRAVAKATGETRRTVARLGFVPLTFTPHERDPFVTDWNAVELARRAAVLPGPRSRRPIV
jgi:hypothetical protein